MTNLDALKAKVGYPMADASFELALTKRGLTSTDIFTGEDSAFELAYADCILVLLTSPSSVQEGGYSIQLGGKDALADIANKIYDKYGKTIPTPKPVAKFVQRW